MISYEEKNIQAVVEMLNNLEVKGVDNCKRVALIAQIIDSPVENEDKGEQGNGGIQ